MKTNEKSIFRKRSACSVAVLSFPAISRAGLSGRGAARVLGATALDAGAAVSSSSADLGAAAPVNDGGATHDGVRGAAASVGAAATAPDGADVGAAA